MGIERELTQKDIWQQLNSIDVSGYIKKKGQLDYLPWSVAIGLVKPYFDMSVRVYENELGFNYHTDGLTCWVKVGVIISSFEEIEYLPIMDFKNKAIPKGDVTSVEVNKAIKRATVKALASHGLGIVLYSKEELPSEPTELIPEPIDTLKEMEEIKDTLDIKDIKAVEIAKAKMLSLHATEIDRNKKAKLLAYGLELKGMIDENNKSN